MTVFRICFCLDNCSVICAVTLCYEYVGHIQNSAIFRNSIYSGILRHIQGYSVLLKYIHAYRGIVKTYSGLSRHSALFVTLGYSQPCHIPSPGIFRTGGIFKILWNFGQVYSDPCHTQNGQNSLFRHYSAKFRNVQNLVQR